MENPIIQNSPNSLQEDTEAGEFPTWTTFIVWFHKLYDRNWDDSSYTKVANIDNVLHFWGVVKNIPPVSSGMFFMMKEMILPQWENQDNRDGGYISYKIDNNKLGEAWNEMMMAFSGGYLTIDPEDLKYINGVSVSPKKFYGIIKVWINSDTIYQESFKNPDKLIFGEIPLINNTDAIYQKNSEK